VKTLKSNETQRTIPKNQTTIKKGREKRGGRNASGGQRLPFLNRQWAGRRTGTWWKGEIGQRRSSEDLRGSKKRAIVEKAGSPA